MSVRLGLVPTAGVPGLTGTGGVVALVGGGRGDTNWFSIFRWACDSFTERIGGARPNVWELTRRTTQGCEPESRSYFR
jgi:hypothetical protein